MTVTLPLAEMTNAEKLELIQVIWDDLDKAALDELPSPDWQREMLEDIDRKLDSGEMKLRDWDNVKKELLSEIS
jgi:hypothetical protein